MSDKYDQAVRRSLKNKRGKWWPDYHQNGYLSLCKGKNVVLHVVPSQRSMVCIEEVARLLEEGRKA